MTANLYGIYTHDSMPIMDAILLHHYFKDELEAMHNLRYEARRSVDYGKRYVALMLCMEHGDSTVYPISSLMGESPYQYAERLARIMWEKHYKEDSPDWKPLRDVLGVLTQIDNMVAGMERKPKHEEETPEMSAVWLQIRQLDMTMRYGGPSEICGAIDAAESALMQLREIVTPDQIEVPGHPDNPVQVNRKP